jgi:hypothetical protein
VNKKQIAECLGHKFRLRPNPIVKKAVQPIKETLNSWTLIDFPDQKRLIFQHNHSDYKIHVEAVYVRGHEPPDMIVLRGQVYLETDLRVSFEPFTEGIGATDDPRQLTDDPTGKHSPSLYHALKPHEGRPVLIRFPSRDGWEYGSQDAILQEVTHHYAKFHVQPINILMLPDNFRDQMAGEPRDRITAPGYDRSIALQFLALEGIEEDRLLLVMEHGNWERRF